MGWVNDARAGLVKGETVQVRPIGGSMRGRIESGQLVTLAPIATDDIGVDESVHLRHDRSRPAFPRLFRLSADERKNSFMQRKGGDGKPFVFRTFGKTGQEVEELRGVMAEIGAAR